MTAVPIDPSTGQAVGPPFSADVNGNQHGFIDMTGARVRAQDKKIEANRGELRALATKVDQVAFSHKLLHFWNVKRWLFGG